MPRGHASSRTEGFLWYVAEQRSYNDRLRSFPNLSNYLRLLGAWRSSLSLAEQSGSDGYCSLLYNSSAAAHAETRAHIPPPCNNHSHSLVDESCGSPEVASDGLHHVGMALHLLRRKSNEGHTSNA